MSCPDLFDDAGGRFEEFLVADDGPYRDDEPYFHDERDDGEREHWNDPSERLRPNVHLGYRAMWLVAAFDLSTDTRAAKRAYRRFRNLLLDEGYSMLQYSVYARYCASEETAQTHRRRLKRNLPDDGEIRLLSVTDRQFEKMEVFLGKTRVPTEQPPDQLERF